MCSSDLGGEAGYDKSLSAFEPKAESVDIGMAGEQPPSVARYLMAANQGAGDTRVSPDGRDIACTWSITGAPQLWVVPSAGG